MNRPNTFTELQEAESHISEVAQTEAFCLWAQGDLAEFVTTQTSWTTQNGKEKLYCKDVVAMARVFRFSFSEKLNILIYNLMKLDFLSFRHSDRH